MASIERGDVFLVNFDPTVGAKAKKTRPAVIVSNNVNNAHSPLVSISPITSNVSKVYSFEVEVPAGTGGLKPAQRQCPIKPGRLTKSASSKKWATFLKNLLTK
jgi:Growth inhibitor